MKKLQKKRNPRKSNLDRLLNVVFLLSFLFGTVASAAIITAMPEPTPHTEATTELVTVQKAEPTTTEPETELTTTEPETEEPDVRTKNIELIGRTIWGEAGGVESTAERAAVAWCILNRVDATGKTIEEVVTAPSQFYGYRTYGDCPEEHLELAEDVLARWEAEKNGTCASGRTLPAGYLYFTGDGQRNHFTKTWGGTDYWTWSLPNPY
jgi:hypothetical protein